jgi:hypothetical protein
MKSWFLNFTASFNDQNPFVRIRSGLLSSVVNCALRVFRFHMSWTDNHSNERNCYSGGHDRSSKKFQSNDYKLSKFLCVECNGCVFGCCVASLACVKEVRFFSNCPRVCCVLLSYLYSLHSIRVKSLFLDLFWFFSLVVWSTRIALDKTFK